MNIICGKETLLEAINAASKAVASRSTIPILECLLISADQEGIHMTGNDLQIGIQYNQIEGEIIEEGAIALESRIFSDIVRKSPAEEVLIKTEPNGITIIKSGKSEFKILGYPSDEFPQMPEIGGEEKKHTLILSAAILRDMLKKTVFSIAAEHTKPAFTGELFELEDGVLNLVSSDTFRISQASRPFPNAEADQDNRLSLIVPGKALNEILKILPEKEEENVSICAGDKHILFAFGRCLVASRLINADFIRYRHSFNVVSTTIVKTDREFLWMSLERASLISSKEAKKNPIKMNIGPETLIITTNTEMGASYEEINVETEGEPLEIAFNPKYLIDALKAMEEDRVFLHFTTSLSPVVFKGEGNDSYQFLVLPLRLKD